MARNILLYFIIPIVIIFIFLTRKDAPAPEKTNMTQEAIVYNRVNTNELTESQIQAIKLVEEKIKTEGSPLKRKYTITEVQTRIVAPFDIVVGFAVEFSPKPEHVLDGYATVNSAAPAIKEFIDPLPDEGWQ